jgi:transcriptional regulator with XRE-family HTH domain
MPELEAFFHDLRALRVSAGLSLAELAERAHFPEETLAAAEAGPALPPNPVLVAYVRACGGPVGQWEDRWRHAGAAAADGFLGEVP